VGVKKLLYSRQQADWPLILFMELFAGPQKGHAKKENLD